MVKGGGEAKFQFPECNLGLILWETTILKFWPQIHSAQKVRSSFMVGADIIHELLSLQSYLPGTCKSCYICVGVSKET